MTAATIQARRPVVGVVALLAMFAGAVAVRVAVAGQAGAASIRAGLVFAAILTVAAVVSRVGVAVTPRAVALGLAGVALLVLPVLLTHDIGAARPGGGYATWAIATTAVATAEEAFLRGALYDAVRRARGVDAAVVVGALAFAALHVPLYGWKALPLDFAVGLVLGALRVITGTWTAPAIAHVGADLVGWWLL
jgi:membrane protease YdiL (CAAX protease family)